MSLPILYKFNSWHIYHLRHEYFRENWSDCCSSCGSGRGTILLVLFWRNRAYNSYKKEQEEIVEGAIGVVAAPPKQQEIKIHEQLNKLKQEIDFANPTLEDIKRLFSLLTTYLKSKTMTLSEKCKQERRRLFPKGRRLDNLGEYMRVSSEGLMQIQQSVMQLQAEQTQILGTLGLTQAKIQQFGPQLAPFMQELITGTDITLEEAKLHFQLKIDYLKIYGEGLTHALI
jgi:hypothetical protein